MLRSLKFSDLLGIGYATERTGRMKQLAIAFCVGSTVVAWMTVFGLAFMLK